MSRKKVLFSVFVLFMALLVCSAPALASKYGANAMLRSGKYVLNLDHLYVIFDRTGSMMDFAGNDRKIEVEKFLVRDFFDSVPDWGPNQGPSIVKFTSTFRTLGRSTNSEFAETNLLYNNGEFVLDKMRKQVDKAVDRYPAGETPLYVAINEAAKDLKTVNGKIQMVIFSDGLDMDETTIKSVANLKKLYGDRICINTVQVGNDVNGGKYLERIVQAGKCGFAAKGDNLFTDPGMSSFSEKVFLTQKAEVPVVAKAPVVQEKKVVAEAKPEPPKKAEPVYREEVINLDVKFDFNKAVVKPKYMNDIKRVAEFLKENPDNRVTIEGHTDNVGSKAYNEKLSKKRAEAVADFIVTNFGISKSRINAVGYGFEKPVASNETTDGKQENRRVEAHLKTKIKVEEPTK